MKGGIVAKDISQWIKRGVGNVLRMTSGEKVQELEHRAAALHDQCVAVGKELAAARTENRRLAAELEALRTGHVEGAPDPSRYRARENLILIPKLLDLLPTSDHITIVDAGARSVDEDPRWRPFPKSRIKFFGFEAATEEAERLNAASDPIEQNQKFYPAGLWGSTGRKSFEVNTASGGSSFLEQNRILTDRWKFENETQISLAREMFVPERIVEVPVISLADWSKHENVDEIDFLKINVQGGELEVLRGAGPLLESVMGVFLEVSFVESYKNRPMFSDVDAMLREAGFSFFDLLAHHYVGRAKSRVTARHVNVVEPKLGQLVSSWGQLIEGHAIYFRDPIAAPGPRPIDPHRIIKLAALAEAWGQIEYAFEVLGWLSETDEARGLADKLSSVITASEAEYMRFRV